MTDLYIDFLCPYGWRGAELAAVLRAGGKGFRLRHFSLVEGNHAENVQTRTWLLSDQPAGEGNEYQHNSLAAFLAAQAAARQGEEQSWAFTLALFRLRHEEGRELDEAAIQGAAQTAGLDPAQFQSDRAEDAGLRASLRAETDAAAEIGVFGTPTFVLADGSAAYYRFETLTRDPDTAREWWALFQTVLSSGAGIGTIKRARHRLPPRPSPNPA